MSEKKHEIDQRTTTTITTTNKQMKMRVTAKYKIHCLPNLTFSYSAATDGFFGMVRVWLKELFGLIRADSVVQRRCFHGSVTLGARRFVGDVWRQKIHPLYDGHTEYSLRIRQRNMNKNLNSKNLVSVRYRSEDAEDERKSKPKCRGSAG